MAAEPGMSSGLAAECQAEPEFRAVPLKTEMNEEEAASPMAREEGECAPQSVTLSGDVEEFQPRSPQNPVKGEPDWGALRYGETREQTIPKTAEPPTSGCPNPRTVGSPHQVEAQTSLSSSEVKVEGNRCPSEGQETQTQLGLGAQVQESPRNPDSPKQPEEEPPAEDAVVLEIQRQNFRQFRYQEAQGPQEACSRLWFLCCRWLKPERHTKEQILELLILEQFLTILPAEIQSRVVEGCPKTCAQAVALAEGFRPKKRKLETQEEQVPEEALNFSAPEQIPSHHEPNREGDIEGGSSPSKDLLSATERNHQDVTGEEAANLVEMGSPEGEVSQSGSLEEASKGWPGSKEAQRGPPGEKAGKFNPSEVKEPLDDAAGQPKIPMVKSETGAVDESSFPDNSEVIEFQVTHTGDLPYKCLDCGKSFNYSTSLVRHQRIHTGEKPYKCLDCGKCFCQSSGLTIHQRIHAGEKAYQCLDCGKSFRVKSHLIRHSITHKGEKPYKCAECGVSFCERSELRIHQRIHTGEKPYNCADCGKNFCRKADLTLHQRIHTGEMPYTCLECGKGFRWSSNLITHQKTHTGVKPFECAECGKSYYSNMSLIRHQRVHTGGTPYICSDCGKSFCDSTSLTRHQKIHTGEKPYVCMDCGKSFNRNSNLISHQRTHTGVKPFLCSDCGKNFRSRSELQRHYMIHAGEKSDKSLSGGDPEVPTHEKLDGEQPVRKE
ncbi:uncharacterized protein LOC110091604 [Pogona vitticeps]